MKMKVLVRAASTILLLEGAAMSQYCPSEFTQSTNLTTKEGATLTFNYAIVLSLVSESLDLLCARIESDESDAGYIGFGISPGGTADGGEIVIGIPPDGDAGSDDTGNNNPGTNVKKYNLSGGGSSPLDVSLMPTEKQSLLYAGITQTDGKTVVDFAKFLKEDGEHDIVASGENVFSYALGGSGESIDRDFDLDFVTLDFATTRPPTAAYTSPAPTDERHGTSTGFSRTLAPSPGVVRREPVPTPAPSSLPPSSPPIDASPPPTPADAVTSVAPTPDATIPAATIPAATVADIANPDAPSGATTGKKIDTIMSASVLGLFAVVWFGM